jgi:hypothetical protein
MEALTSQKNRFSDSGTDRGSAGAASWGCLGGQTGPQIDGNGQKSKEKIEKKVDTSFQSIWAGILMNLWCQNGTMLEEKRTQN